MKTPITYLLKNLSADEMNEIVKRIIHLRQDVLHMTQSQFANSINISQTYLSQIEMGKRQLTASTIQQICSSLKVKREWLILGEDTTIFLTKEETAQTILNANQESVISAVCSAFSLDITNEEFLRWYLNLSADERLGFQNAVSFIQRLGC